MLELLGLIQMLAFPFSAKRVHRSDVFGSGLGDTLDFFLIFPVIPFSPFFWAIAAWVLLLPCALFIVIKFCSGKAFDSRSSFGKAFSRSFQKGCLRWYSLLANFFLVPVLGILFQPISLALNGGSDEILSSLQIYGGIGGICAVVMLAVVLPLSLLDISPNPFDVQDLFASATGRYHALHIIMRLSYVVIFSVLPENITTNGISFFLLACGPLGLSYYVIFSQPFFHHFTNRVVAFSNSGLAWAALSMLAAQFMLPYSIVWDSITLALFLPAASFGCWVSHRIFLSICHESDNPESDTSVEICARPLIQRWMKETEVVGSELFASSADLVVVPKTEAEDAGPEEIIKRLEERIYKVFKNGTSTYPDSAFIYYCSAACLFTIKGDVASGFSSIHKAQNKNPWFDLKYRILGLRKTFQELQISGRSRDGAEHDLVAYVQFQRDFQEATKSRKHAKLLINQFWEKLFIERRPLNAPEVSKLVGEIILAVKRTKTLHKAFMNTHRESPRIFRSYAKYLDEIEGEHEIAQKLVEKADWLHEEAFSKMMNGSETLRADALDDLAGIITINSHGIMQSVNKKVLETFGYKKQQMIGENVAMIMPNPYRGKHDQYLRRYLDTNVPHVIGKESRFVIGVSKSGMIIPIHLSMYRVDVADEILFTGILQPISANVGVLSFDSSFIVTGVNEPTCNMTQFPNERLVGMNASRFLPWLSTEFDDLKTQGKLSNVQLMGRFGSSKRINVEILMITEGSMEIYVLLLVPSVMEPPGPTESAKTKSTEYSSGHRGHNSHALKISSSSDTLPLLQAGTADDRPAAAAAANPPSEHLVSFDDTAGGVCPVAKTEGASGGCPVSLPLSASFKADGLEPSDAIGGGGCPVMGNSSKPSFKVALRMAFLAKHRFDSIAQPEDETKTTENGTAANVAVEPQVEQVQQLSPLSAPDSQPPPPMDGDPTASFESQTVMTMAKRSILKYSNNDSEQQDDGDDNPRPNQKVEKTEFRQLHETSTVPSARSSNDGDVGSISVSTMRQRIRRQLNIKEKSVTLTRGKNRLRVILFCAFLCAISVFVATFIFWDTIFNEIQTMQKIGNALVQTAEISLIVNKIHIFAEDPVLSGFLHADALQSRLVQLHDSLRSNIDETYLSKGSASPAILLETLESLLVQLKQDRFATNPQTGEVESLQMLNVDEHIWEALRKFESTVAYFIENRHNGSHIIEHHESSFFILRNGPSSISSGLTSLIHLFENEIASQNIFLFSMFFMAIGTLFFLLFGMVYPLSVGPSFRKLANNALEVHNIFDGVEAIDIPLFEKFEMKKKNSAPTQQKQGDVDVDDTQSDDVSLAEEEGQRANAAASGDISADLSQFLESHSKSVTDVLHKKLSAVWTAQQLPGSTTTGSALTARRHQFGNLIKFSVLQRFALAHDLTSGLLFWCILACVLFLITGTACLIAMSIVVVPLFTTLSHIFDQQAMGFLTIFFGLGCLGNPQFVSHDTACDTLSTLFSKMQDYHVRYFVQNAWFANKDSNYILYRPNSLDLPSLLSSSTTLDLSLLLPSKSSMDDLFQDFFDVTSNIFLDFKTLVSSNNPTDPHLFSHFDKIHVYLQENLRALQTIFFDQFLVQANQQKTIGILLGFILLAVLFFLQFLVSRIANRMERDNRQNLFLLLLVPEKSIWRNKALAAKLSKIVSGL